MPELIRRTYREMMRRNIRLCRRMRCNLSVLNENAQWMKVETLFWLVYFPVVVYYL